VTLASSAMARLPCSAGQTLARHGMAWHGMAWHGMAWYGMVWHGAARHRRALRSMVFIERRARGDTEPPWPRRAAVLF